jgi:hypothetical protein
MRGTQRGLAEREEAMKAACAYAAGVAFFVVGLVVPGLAAVAGARVLWVRRREALARERRARRKPPLVMRMFATMGGDL